MFFEAVEGDPVGFVVAKGIGAELDLAREGSRPRAAMASMRSLISRLESG